MLTTAATIDEINNENVNRHNVNKREHLLNLLAEIQWLTYKVFLRFGYRWAALTVYWRLTFFPADQSLRYRNGSAPSHIGSHPWGGSNQILRLVCPNVPRLWFRPQWMKLPEINWAVRKKQCSLPLLSSSTHWAYSGKLSSSLTAQPVSNHDLA